MTARTLADQLRPTVPAAAPGCLNWTLTRPDGTHQRGEEVITEAEWLAVVRALADARARHIR